MTNSHVPHTPAAVAYRNEKFMLVVSLSGHGSYAQDYDAPLHFLPLDAASGQVGGAVRAALAQSRQIGAADIDALFDADTAAERNAGWIAEMMTRFAYKTKRALLANMACVEMVVDESGSMMSFYPMQRASSEHWVRAQDETGSVVVPGDSSDEQVGSALRLALFRCL